MLAKVFAGIAVFIALWSTTDAYTHKSALVLREKNIENFSPRRGTSLSGSYGSNGKWIFIPSRSSYGDFQGGGPGTGK